MIVGARRTSPPSRCTSWVEASIRVIDLVTRISAPSLRACWRAPARQLLARHARREAEVVLDPGGGSRLAAGRLALDHDRPEPLRGGVHGGCQAGGPRTDDRGVVLRGGRLGRDVEELCHPAKLRSHGRLAVHHTYG